MSEIKQGVSLTGTIAEILSLQTQYSPNNTDMMKRRGELIRSVLPGIRRRQMPSIRDQDSLANTEECSWQSGRSCDGRWLSKVVCKDLSDRTNPVICYQLQRGKPTWDGVI